MVTHNWDNSFAMHGCATIGRIGWRLTRRDTIAQLQIWIGRGERWNQVIQRWWDTHTLAPAADVGLAPAPASSGK